MLLRKTLSLSDVSLKMDGDAGRFAGYASKFGGVDLGGDTIVKGAFEYTLRTNGKPKMFLEHAPFTGASGSAALPIGKWDVVKEDDQGLYVEGTLTPGMSLAADVRAAMKHGTLDGLSIGGLVRKGDYDETENGRVIRRWTKLIEISPVTMPMDESARIDLSSVKSADMADAIEAIDSIRDLESFLRDAGGLSKGAAVALVARAKRVLVGEGDPAEGSAEAKHIAQLAERFRQLAQ
jgi:HK97 family phage prohead protease